MNNLKKTALATAMVASMGVVSTSASAAVLTMSFTGQFTLADAAGTLQVNPDSSDPGGIPGVGSQRTPVSGTGSFDTLTGSGTAIINPFSFFGGGAATASSITFQAVGGIDASGNSLGPGTGTIVIGQMGFNWNNNFAIPVTDVFDAAGFFANIPAPGTTGVIATGCVGCATSTTPNAGLGSPAVIGAVPMAMTTWNTAGTTIGTAFPLSTDGVSGSPMTTAPFPGFNANFDFTSMTVTNPATVIPVPAAVWLFGSGLMGLVGVARRRKS